MSVYMEYFFVQNKINNLVITCKIASFGEFIGKQLTTTSNMEFHRIASVISSSSLKTFRPTKVMI